LQPPLARPRGRCGVSEWYRMTVDALKDCNKKHLAQLAKDQGIAGWHAMRKDQLIRALSVPRPAAASAKPKTGSRPTGPPARREGPPVRSSSTNGNGNGKSNGHGNGHAATLAAAQ